MDGVQKKVVEGLNYLADKVAGGAYGENDYAFSDPLSKDAFLDDLDAAVIGLVDIDDG